MSRRFVTLDVFTATPLEGNPLAVVLDADDLDDGRMQAIAREFALSETAFVRAPANPRHRASLRIFTPARELAFAGHPLIGAASLIALREGARDAMFALEIGAGLVACVVERRGPGRAYARFRAPQTPSALAASLDASAVARALGLSERDVAFSHQASEVWTAGTAFPLVPVATLDALARAAPGADLDAATGGYGHVYLFVQTGARAFRARMFAPDLGISEDPATGGAVAAFAGLLFKRAPHGEGHHDYVIDQGVEMGRPSRIELQLVVQDGVLSGVEIGGEAVIVSEGRLKL